MSDINLALMLVQLAGLAVQGYSIWNLWRVRRRSLAHLAAQARAVEAEAAALRCLRLTIAGVAEAAIGSGAAAPPPGRVLH